MAPSLYQDPYHHNIVRTPLTRNIGARFPDVQDELAAAFKDEVPPKNGGYRFFFQYIIQSLLNLRSHWT